MTREETTTLLRQLTGGCASAVLDGVLYACYLAAAGASQRRTIGGTIRAGRIADAFFDQCNAATVRSWLSRLRANGWIGDRLTVTAEGQRRLRGLLPSIRWHEPWEGCWYLVSFDIAEQMRVKRNAFRASLQRLGFGKLHASVWMSPWNMLGDVSELVQVHGLGDAIVMAMSPKVGTREAKDLADRVWNLGNVNERYREIARSVSSDRNGGDPFLVGRILAVLRDDPQLPKALLPRPWYGFDALRTVRRIGGPSLARLLQ